MKYNFANKFTNIMKFMKLIVRHKNMFDKIDYK